MALHPAHTGKSWEKWGVGTEAVMYSQIFQDACIASITHFQRCRNTAQTFKQQTGRKTELSNMHNHSGGKHTAGLDGFLKLKKSILEELSWMNIFGRSRMSQEPFRPLSFW